MIPDNFYVNIQILRSIGLNLGQHIANHSCLIHFPIGSLGYAFWCEESNLQSKITQSLDLSNFLGTCFKGISSDKSYDAPSIPVKGPIGPATYYGSAVL